MSFALVAMLLVGCGGNKDVHTYDNSLFQLASGFSAKEMCSCLFVMQRPESDCAEWTRVSPDVAKYKVDHDAKSVRSRALGMGKTVARWESERTGCVIVEDENGR